MRHSGVKDDDEFRKKVGGTVFAADEVNAQNGRNTASSVCAGNRPVPVACCGLNHSHWHQSRRYVWQRTNPPPGF